jgi:outer membrane immunogenic protein
MKYVVSIAMVCGVIATASAADLPVKAPYYKAPVAAPAFNWSGFYAGGHFGYLWGRTHVEEDAELVERNAATNGVVGGVLGGYNWQLGAWVLGLDADFGWSNAHGRGSSPPPPPEVTTLVEPNRYDINWTSHVRGRVGYAFDTWLVYAAGGLAVADFTFHPGDVVTTTTTFGFDPNTGVLVSDATTSRASRPSTSKTYAGFSIGGGVEHAFNSWLIGRVEYFYDDFGHKDYASPDGDTYRVGLKAQTVRGALSVKF